MSASRWTDISPAVVRIEELADGVYSYVQPDGSWWINNSGFLAAGDRTVLIDTCATDAAHSAPARRGDASDGSRGEHRRQHPPSRRSHHGNYLAGAATIIGHRNTRKLMIATGIQVNQRFDELEGKVDGIAGQLGEVLELLRKQN